MLLVGGGTFCLHGIQRNYVSFTQFFPPEELGWMTRIGENSQVLSPPRQTHVVQQETNSQSELTLDAIDQRYAKFEEVLKEFWFSRGKPERDFWREKDWKTQKGTRSLSGPRLKDVGIFTRLHAGQKGLDLGCAEGISTILLASVFDLQMTGIEDDETLLGEGEEFSKLAVKKGIIRQNQVRLLKGDFLTFPWGEYDLIYYFAGGSDDFLSIIQKLIGELRCVFLYKGPVRSILEDISLGKEEMIESAKLKMLINAGFNMQVSMKPGAGALLFTQSIHRQLDQSL